MIKQASNVRKHLRRFLTADPGRFAGGSAVSDPLGLLAVERERLAALRSPQHDGSPQPAAGRAAHYPSEYREFTGIMVPALRLVYVRNPDGSPVLDSTSIAVDVTG